MKRATTLVLPTLLLCILPVLAASSQPKIVGVDYVLALMDAGIDQKEIVHRIEEKNLAFRLAPGDLDRLREAGAGKNLIEVISAESAVLENHEGARAGGTAAPQDQRGTGASQWGRPSRLGGEGTGTPEGGAPPPEGSQAPSTTTPDDEAEYNGEGIQEEPYGGSGGYGGYGGYGAYPDYDYWPGYYGFVYSYGYPYPYYYYPRYYYPYRSYYFSSPYYTYRHHSFGYVPRGGGSFRGGFHGGGGSPRSSPRGGGGSRPSPRGSHH